MLPEPDPFSGRGRARSASRRDTVRGRALPGADDPGRRYHGACDGVWPIGPHDTRAMTNGLNGEISIMRFARTLNRFGLAVALVAGLLPSAWAQISTGGIYGKVTDEQSAVLPGATVTLTGTNIGAKTTTSGPRGEFRFLSLDPATYTVDRHHAGLRHHAAHGDRLGRRQRGGQLRREGRRRRRDHHGRRRDARDRHQEDGHRHHRQPARSSQKLPELARPVGVHAHGARACRSTASTRPAPRAASSRASSARARRRRTRCGCSTAS